MNDQARILGALAAEQRTQRRPSRARTVAIAGGTAGVGATTLAANLAVALGQAGTRVVLVDAGQGAVRAARLLGLTPRQTLQHVLDGVATLPGITLAGPYGARVVPATAGLDDLGNLSPWQEERLSAGFAEIDQEADLVLLDAGSGSAPGMLERLAIAPEIVVVATPQADATTGAYALIKRLAQRGDAPRIHVLVNRIYARYEGTATATRIREVAERFLGIRVDSLGFVPEAPEVERAGQEGQAFVAAAPLAAASRAVAAIAQQLGRAEAGRPSAPLSGALRHLSMLRAQRQAPALAPGTS